MDNASAHDAWTRALADRYRIEGVLGEGAAARVYRAYDLKHDRPVALKLMKPDVAAAVGARRFVEEIRTTATLRHPHILPLFDSGEVDGQLYAVTPFIDGETLRGRLDREGRLDLSDALAVARDVGAALAYAHARGVVHRDIKPENILLGDGGALVADFGIALALGTGSEASPRLTATGLVVGTPRYISPEQIGGETVDGRSDLFALACVVYEMLVGTAPFEADTVQGLIGQILTYEPVSPASKGVDIPAEVSQAVLRGLAKDPDHRFDTVDEFLDALGPAVHSATTTGRRGVGLGWGIAVVALVTLAGSVGWRTVQRSEARSALLDVGALVDQEAWRAAYDRAVAVERWIPEDSVLQRYLLEVSDLVTVRSDPRGATVRIEAYDPGAGTASTVETLGVTPIVDRRLPRGEHRLTIELEGHVALERIASTGLTREPLVTAAEGRRLEIDVTLRPDSAVPTGSVPVPGGEYLLSSPDAPSGSTHPLSDFAIDRFEVSNQAYAAFVEDGGYENDAWWSGVEPQLRRQLRDRTGLPAPREWERRRHPDGRERHPVSGVTWFEARAFCAWAGKRLPSIYEWEKAGRDGRTAVIGVVMPWGQEGSALSTGERANFASSGTVPVDAFPFGVSPYGVYGMAGNVREWVANSSGPGRVIAGGSWLGPSYLFSEYTAEPPDFASPGVGFRCAAGAGDSGGDAHLAVDPPPPSYQPVDEPGFRALLDFYRYDPVPARPRDAGRTETADWVRERVWIDGLEGDSILVYAWLPKGADPPHQTVLYIASSAAFSGKSVPDEAEWVIAPVIQAGRAVVAPVLRGMVERPVPGFRPPDPPTVAFRELMVAHVTEVRMAVDYALGRPDIDADALAYATFSFGAGSRLPMAVVEDRFDALVLIGGGIDERVKPTLPEADNVNFAPYIAAPVLLVNGANDEEHPWATRGSPLWNLLSEPKELVLVEGGGHLPPLEARILAIQDFLDRVLGPVGGG